MATQKAQRADIDAGDAGTRVNTGASTAKAAKSAGKVVGKAASAKVIDLATRRAQADIKANGAKPVAAPGPAPIAPAEPVSSGNSIRDQYREVFGRDPARGRSFAQMKLDMEFHETHSQYQDLFGKSAGNMPISKVRAAVEQHQNRLEYQKAFGQSADHYAAPSRVGAAVEAHKQYVDVFGENPKNRPDFSPRGRFGFGKQIPPTAEQMHAQISRANNIGSGWGNGPPPSRASNMVGPSMIALSGFVGGMARAHSAKEEGASPMQQAGQFAIGAAHGVAIPGTIAGGLYAMGKHATLGKFAPSIGRGLLPVSMALSAAAYGGASYARGDSGWKVAGRTAWGAVNGAIPIDLAKEGYNAVKELWKKPTAPGPVNPGDTPTAGRQRKMTSGEQRSFAEANRHYEDSHMQGQSAKGDNQQPDHEGTGLRGFQHARTQAFAQAGKAAKRGTAYNGPDPSSIDVAERAQRAGA